MGLQTSVNKFQVLGVPGEFADNSPSRVTPYTLEANSTVAPAVGCVFTQSTTGDSVAKVGGSGAFLGVCVEPKQYANKDLTATLNLAAGQIGEICSMGHIFVKSATQFKPGYLAEYEPATGVISAIEDTLSTATAVQIPDAQFIQVSGAAGHVGILELGAFGVPTATAYS